MLFMQVGPLTKENVIESHRVLHAAIGFDPSYDTIVDYQLISKIEVGVQDLKDIIEAVKDIEKRTGRGAFVIGSNFGRFALAKLFCDLAENLSTTQIFWKAFKTMEEAEDWLDSK